MIRSARRSSGAPRRGFEYSDCWADDARLVVLNALDAAERGAVIRTRTRCIGAERGEDWQLVLDVRGRRDVATARVLVNATGPWLELFARDRVARGGAARRCGWTRAATSWCARLFEHDRGYIFQTHDGRVVFALPFERDFTLIGTTDQGFRRRSERRQRRAPTRSPTCAARRTSISARRSRPADVVWSFAGVRSLYDDGSSKRAGRHARLCPRRSTSAPARRRC